MSADGPVVFDPKDFGLIPRPGALRRWMRTARRRRADRTVWQQFEDVYLVVFTVAMLAATGGSVVERLNEQQLTACYSDRCDLVLGAVPAVLLLLLVGAGLRMLLAVGPVSASQATGFWLLATPIDRSAALWPTYRLVVGTAALAGGLVAGVVLGVAGFPLPFVVETVLLGATLAACSACGAVLAQQSETASRWVLRFADLLLVAAVGVIGVTGWRALTYQPSDPDATVLLFVLEGSPERWLGLTSGEQQWLVRLGVCCLVVVVLAVLTTARFLRRLPRASIVAGGDLLTGIAGAAVTLDVGLLGDVLTGRYWRRIGRARSRRGRSFGLVAFVHRELLRILRRPRRLVVGAALLVVPYAVSAAGAGVLVPLVAGLAGFAAVRPLLDGLRSVGRSTGLVRALGMDLRQLRTATAVVPAAFTALWVIAAAPVLGHPATVFAVGAGILAGAVRQASAPPPSYGGPLIASPMGAIPPGLFSQPLRGFDLLLLCLVPVLLEWSPTWRYLIPAATLAILFSLQPKPRR